MTRSDTPAGPATVQQERQSEHNSVNVPAQSGRPPCDQASFASESHRPSWQHECRQYGMPIGDRRDTDGPRNALLRGFSLRLPAPRPCRRNRIARCCLAPCGSRRPNRRSRRRWQRTPPGKQRAGGRSQRRHRPRRSSRNRIQPRIERGIRAVATAAPEGGQAPAAHEHRRREAAPPYSGRDCGEVVCALAGAAGGSREA